MKGRSKNKMFTDPKANSNFVALRAYEGRVRSFTDQLISLLDSNTGKAVNAARWFNFYSFDIMGDMAFGQSFDMMKTDRRVSLLPCHTEVFLILPARNDRIITRSPRASWTLDTNFLVISITSRHTWLCRWGKGVSKVQQRESYRP